MVTKEEINKLLDAMGLNEYATYEVVEKMHRAVGGTLVKTKTLFVETVNFE